MKNIFLSLLSSIVFWAASNAQNDNVDRNQKLIEAKNSFEIVQSTEAKTPISFQKIILFKQPALINNSYYDAFVFKTSRGGYLYWSFQMDTTYLGSWYMLKDTTLSYLPSAIDSTHLYSSHMLKNPTKKEQKKIQYFSDFNFDGKRLTLTPLFTAGQSSVPKLEANSVYIIWFEAKTKNIPAGGVPTIISLNLLEDNAISVKDFFAGYFTFDN